MTTTTTATTATTAAAAATTTTTTATTATQKRTRPRTSLRPNQSKEPGCATASASHIAPKRNRPHVLSVRPVSGGHQLNLITSDMITVHHSEASI